MQTQTSAPLGRADTTLPTLAPADTTDRVARPDVDAAAATDRGKVRERNEDQYLVTRLGRWMRITETSVGQPQELTRDQGLLVAVADGMGGQGAGDIASAVTLDAFVAHSLLEMPWLATGTPEGDALLAKDLRKFVVDCQARLWETAARKGLPPRLGTTLTAAYLQGQRLVLAHVGDSRAYLWRAGTLTRLTKDHTLGAALAENAPGVPGPAGLSHVLVNAIGGDDELPRAELRGMVLTAGDRVLLATDGLHGPVDDARIAELLGQAPNARAAVDALVAEALSRGGPDNVTALAIFP